MTSETRTHARIAWQLPIVAGLIAIGIGASVAAAAHPAGTISLLVLIVYLAAVTPELTLIDLAEHRLPNRLVLPGYGAAAVTLIALGVELGRVPSNSLLVGGVYVVLFVLMNVLGGMGMGDVKLSGLIGIAMGALSDAAPRVNPSAVSLMSALSPAFACLLISFVLGGVVGLVVLAQRKGTRRTRIAFGPFMLAGLWLTLAAVAFDILPVTASARG